MQENTPQAVVQEQKPTDKEINFRAVEAKYQRELEKERSARLELERVLQEKSRQPEPEDDDSEPYVDHKRLNKTMASFERKMEEKFDKRVEEKARGMMQKQKEEDWLSKNKDFYDVMQHAEKIYHKNPELAESILNMPDNFERQKLVYSSIKTMELHQPAQKGPSTQDKIDANRRNPGYQPSGMASPAYGHSGDFSAAGQKQAYAKMQELKSRLGG